MAFLAPDTCDCVIEFSYDKDLPLDKIESSYKLVAIQKGKCHAGLSDDDAYQAAWHIENKTKNQVEAKLKASLPLATTIDINGNTVWKDNVQFKWAFDANRNLTVKIEGQAIDKGSIQTIVDAGKFSIPVIAV